MPPSRKSFSSILNREVTRLANKHEIKKFRAFSVWFAQVAADLSEEEAVEASSIDGANDKGIDLFSINREDGKVIIAQSKYNENGDYRPKTSEVDALLGSVNWLNTPESLRRDGKPDLATAAEEYLDAIKQGYGTEFWFVYCGPKCANVEKHIAVYCQNREHVEARRACRHCDMSLLQTYNEQTTGNVTRLQQGAIKLVKGSHFEYRAQFGEALVATVPASELVRLYREHEDKLFDRNVRLFLGAKKGSVNAVIAETLEGSERNNFWAYNNGLTIVCSEFELDGNTVSMSNFCIVNGCQSTRSLVDHEDKLTPNVNVLVRVLAVSDKIVDDVVRYNNSQNPIRAWDLASQYKTQRRLAKDFAKLKKPYIYTTRRGDRPRENLAKYKSGGKIRQIKLSEVAQYVAALIGQPVMAYRNKAFIFSTNHDDVFPHDIKAEEVLFASICSEQVKAVVNERRSGASDAEGRILLKGGSIFTMAVLGFVAQLRNGTAYLKTMDEEQIASNLVLQR